MSICPKCKKRITKKANRKKVEGIWIHKKCPKKIPEELSG